MKNIVMKLIRIILAYKCVKAMKHRYRDKEHQLMKIREEEQELAEAVDREITREELRIIETMKDDNCFKYAYCLYVKNTKAEERADCFIAWSGMLVTNFPKRRTFLMQREYCQNMQDVKHILLKLRYNKIRDDWT
jgi:hypothetical protein